MNSGDTGREGVSAGRARRYTIRLRLKPGDRTATYAAVTTMGELLAAVMAALRHSRVEPEDRIVDVELVSVEEDFTPDPKDLLSYWEVS